MSDPAPSWHSLLSGVRDGWHAAGGGCATDCPGCPVCRLTEGGTVPARSREHLAAALGHAASAGQELLAALQAASAPPQPRPGPSGAEQDATGPEPAAGTAATAGTAGAQRVRIPVDEQEDTA